MVITYKNKFNKKYGFDKDKSHTLEEISRLTGYELSGLKIIIEKGLGAYYSNPTSVRPSVDNAEQWALARVYSAVMGGRAANIDKTHLIKIGIVAPKTNYSKTLLENSNPIKAQSNAFKYLGKSAFIYPSTKKDKKYMILDPNTGKYIHFGQLGYKDFTFTGDIIKQKAYLTRTANMRGNWKNNPYSANNLAREILWR